MLLSGRMRCTRLMSVWIHPYFDLETGIVIKGKPLGAKEGVRCREVFISLKSPVSSAEQLAHLAVIDRVSSRALILPEYVWLLIQGDTGDGCHYYLLVGFA